MSLCLQLFRPTSSIATGGLGALLVMGLLGGCAAPLPLAHIEQGQRVELRVLAVPAGEGVVRIVNGSLGAGAKGGTAAGLVAGGLWGLACGPFFLLCAPIGAAVLALPGAALGTAAGAAAALPTDKATLLRDRLSRVQQSVDLEGALRANVIQRAQKYWTLGAETAAWVLTLELQNLELSSTHDEQIGMVVRVAASLRRSDAAASAAPALKTFEYTAPPGSLSVWLDERSDFLDTLLRAAAQQLAAQIVSELASP